LVSLRDLSRQARRLLSYAMQTMHFCRSGQGCHYVNRALPRLKCHKIHSIVTPNKLQKMDSQLRKRSRSKPHRIRGCSDDLLPIFPRSIVINLAHREPARVREPQYS
jgi:hypothetical protein